VGKHPNDQSKARDEERLHEPVRRDRADAGDTAPPEEGTGRVTGQEQEYEEALEEAVEDIHG